MNLNEELFEFLIYKAPQLTEDWYNDLVQPTGVYALSTKEEIHVLKEQNNQFHLKFFQVFVAEEDQFLKEMEEWVLMVAQDEHHLLTPRSSILDEFYRTRNQHLNAVREFAILHKASHEQLDAWRNLIMKNFDKVTIWFMKEYDKFSAERLVSHQQLIHELSSPVILITKNNGLLPLVGNIDAERAAFILEKTLKRCDEKKLDRLFIDLSGVLMLDTMVAQQLFMLHDSLNLIGVKTIFCGIRPEIAQTAVHLGLSFDAISVYATLERALSSQVF